MSTEDEIRQFEQMHPHPDQAGLTSLFRFSRVTLPEDRLRLLFLEGKLYHPLPSQFNDPFECRPHFRWPGTTKAVQNIRKHLVNVARSDGKSRNEAETIITNAMSKPDFVRNTIHGAVSRALSEVRVCSFTSSKNNLLFWAHYADSHRGFCVEYDATASPIAYAFEVHYSKKYPEVQYPAPNDARGLKPVLSKSKEWAYEEEFRTIFVPEANRAPQNDGTSLILSGNAIRNVYFGAFMEERHKELLLDLINQGPFSPGIWQTNLSQSDFELQFELLEQLSA